MSAVATKAALDLDVAILGGGLSGGLCALALAEHAPALRVAIVEQSTRLAGNHTWCCHASDLGVDPRSSVGRWFWPLVEHRWPRYRVAFPTFTRTIDGDYCCVPSRALERAVSQAMDHPGWHLLLGERVESATGTEVVLESGGRLRAKLVLDARGSRAARAGCGYQKFLGWEIACETACDESDDAQQVLGRIPLLMDARVEQVDGYRFVYVLPMSPTRFLVEDTYFSRDPILEPDTLARRLRAYLSAHGVRRYSIVRQESGVLPMPWKAGNAVQDEHDSPAAPLAIGYRAGLFHPATGYSLGLATQAADRIARALGAARQDDLREPAAAVVATLRTEVDTNLRFARALNLLAFRAIPGTWLRRLVFAAVYRLPPALLERFYAAQTNARDRLALLRAVARLSSHRLHLTPNASLPSIHTTHLNGESS